MILRVELFTGLLMAQIMVTVRTDINMNMKTRSIQQTTMIC